ncbi:hypothetical protein HYH03_017553 [Edaphochlamys debaryana]|uniref:Uncharacterized protein n=1 Tax=Edaphochlamys debaryana TaxID=47281 RepID=A0A836BNT3_9CHLO|nr:hypothetical protein HYH03_017553 [Edaphochlamys debaryana]|eukprot:KAG2483611.1 hypothetical protein HYH03_017553 [Edaphochlamys debaryana]
MRSAAFRVLASPWAGLGALESGVAARSADAVSRVGARSYAAIAVSGDAAGVISAVDAVVSHDSSAGAKDVSDAAVSLAYLGARGNRRVWGKVLEKAASLGAGLDGPSLANLTWALSAANVEHGRTVAELSGPLAAALKTLTPAQISYAVEAIGGSGSADVELFSAVADMAEARAADFRAADLARLLWGFGAAGVQDNKLVKAASAGLVAKAAELGGREAAQALWGLAALKRVPDAALSAALAKGLKAGLEAPADAAGAAWALATLAVKADAGAVKALADKAKAGAADLSAAQAVQGGWGLAMLGDKDGAAALLGAAAAAVQKNPAALSPSGLALLHAGAVASGAALPAPVGDFAAKGFGLASEHARHTRGSVAAAFHTELAEAVAYAIGARNRPDTEAKVASFVAAAPDGSTLDLVVPVDGATKLAVLGVEKELLATSGAVLGGSLAAARVREAQGYKVALVPASEWPAGAPVKQRAAAALAAIKKAVPALGSMADKLNAGL